MSITIPPMLKMLGITPDTLEQVEALMKVLLSLPERLDNIDRKLSTLGQSNLYSPEDLALCPVNGELEHRMLMLETAAHEHKEAAE